MTNLRNMISPGSSNTNICSDSTMVELKILYRSAILHAIQILESSKTPTRAANNSFISNIRHRSQLSKNILEIRILLSRLLIAFRWYKMVELEPEHTIYDLIYKGPENNIQRSLSKIRNLINTLQANKRRLSKNFNNKSNSNRLDNLNFRYQYKQTIFQLMNSGVPKRIDFVSYSQKYVFFRSSKKYSFKLKINKNGSISISNYDILWPNNLTITSEILFSITQLLNTSIQKSHSILDTIDNILNTVYLHGQFFAMIKSCFVVQSNYPIKYEYNSPSSSVRIYFPKLYSQFPFFQIKIDHDRIVLASLCPVYLPEHFLPFSNDTFNRSTSSNLENLKKVQLLLDLPGQFHSADMLLSYLRDVVYYTKLIKIWFTTIHVLRSISFFYFDLKMKSNSVNSSKIEFLLSSFPLLSLNLDSWTGSILLNFARKQETTKLTFSYVEPREMYNVLSKILQASVSCYSFEKLYKADFPLKFYFINPKLISFKFSFAPNFRINLHAEYGRPHFNIFDDQMNRHTTPEIIELNSSGMKYAWMMLERVLESSKNFIFILQLEIYLTEAKISYLRLGNILTINLPFCESCRLSISNSQWKLSYCSIYLLDQINQIGFFSGENETSYQLLNESNFPELTQKIINEVQNMPQNSMTIIQGNFNMSQAAKIVTNLIFALHRLKLNMWHIAILSLKSKACGYPFYSNTNFLMFQFQNKIKNGFYLTFNEGLKFCGCSQALSFYEFMGRRIPQIKAKMLTLTPVQSYLTNVAKSNRDCFALSFINHAAIPLLKLCEIFNFIDFTITFNSYNDIFLVYKNKYTILGQLKPIHSFVFRVSKNPPNDSFIMVLHSVKKSSEGNRIDVSVNKLVDLRDLLIQTVDFVEETQRLGFVKGKPQENQIQFLLKPSNSQKIVVVLTPKGFNVLIERASQSTKILKEITANYGLNCYLLRSLIKFIQTCNKQPFFNGDETDNPNLSYILSLVHFLKVNLNLSGQAVAKSFDSIIINEVYNGVDISLNIEKSRNEKFTIIFKITNHQIPPISTFFESNGIQRVEINSFEDILRLINQRNTFLSTI